MSILPLNYHFDNWSSETLRDLYNVKYMYPIGITNTYSIKANNKVCIIPGDILRVIIIAAKKIKDTKTSV